MTKINFLKVQKITDHLLKKVVYKIKSGKPKIAKKGWR
jgi:hypothetical protein